MNIEDMSAVLSPYLSLTIGEREFGNFYTANDDLNPQHGDANNKSLSTLVSFKFHKFTSRRVRDRGDASTDCEVVLCGAEVKDIESYIRKCIDKNSEISVGFKYGYKDGPSSKYYRGIITNFTPEFNPDNTVNLTLSIKINPPLNNNPMPVQSEGAEYTYSYNKHSDAANDLAWRLGYGLANDFTETQDLQEPFTIKYSEFTIEQAFDEIAKSSISKDGIGNYVAIIEHDSVSNKNILHFCPISKYVATSATLNKSYNFFINGDAYGRVLQWAPEYSGTQLMVSKFNDTKVGMILQDTNEIVSADIKSTVPKDKYSSEVLDTAIKYGLKPLINVNSNTYRLKSEAYYYRNWENFVDTTGSVVNATLTIVGDPELYAGDYINVIPVEPGGSVHHSGGTYQIISIEEDIIPTYTSVLHLNKYMPSDGNPKSINMLEIAFVNEFIDPNTVSD